MGSLSTATVSPDRERRYARRESLEKTEMTCRVCQSPQAPVMAWRRGTVTVSGELLPMCDETQEIPGRPSRTAVDDWTCAGAAREDLVGEVGVTRRHRRAEASNEDAARLSDRHQVRVGIDRGIVVGALSEVVLLPEGWEYNADAVIRDGKTVNVGDVVVVHLEPARTSGASVCVLVPEERIRWQDLHLDGVLTGPCTKVGRRPIAGGSIRCSNPDESRRHRAQHPDTAANPGAGPGGMRVASVAGRN